MSRAGLHKTRKYVLNWLYAPLISNRAISRIRGSIWLQCTNKMTDSLSIISRHPCSNLVFPVFCPHPAQSRPAVYDHRYSFPVTFLAETCLGTFPPLASCHLFTQSIEACQTLLPGTCTCTRAGSINFVKVNICLGCMACIA
ncbi:unnamed protein product [Periconia digitata]|uniref:Uncharacterized protein n=1 Tax=Periconia digitata TaxID=1303443 RepID=A0A9W4U7F7_9PLEO|nr:unnamed protein product [Periconia digitata]